LSTWRQRCHLPSPERLHVAVSSSLRPSVPPSLLSEGATATPRLHLGELSAWIDGIFRLGVSPGLPHPPAAATSNSDGTLRSPSPFPGDAAGSALEERDRESEKLARELVRCPVESSLLSLLALLCSPSRVDGPSNLRTLELSLPDQEGLPNSSLSTPRESPIDDEDRPKTLAWLLLAAFLLLPPMSLTLSFKRSQLTVLLSMPASRRLVRLQGVPLTRALSSTIYTNCKRRQVCISLCEREWQSCSHRLFSQRTRHTPTCGDSRKLGSRSFAIYTNTSSCACRESCQESKKLLKVPCTRDVLFRW
jgi:hypothetical protein